MNYNSVILCGLCFLVTIWWLVSASKRYPGPSFHQVYDGDENKETVPLDHTDHTSVLL